MDPLKTEEFVKEVYAYTKDRLEKEYKTDIIALFHIEDHIEAYQKDADVISGILGLSPQTKIGEVYMVRFPESDLEVFIDKLTKAGLGVSLSEIRDKNGVYYLDAYQESPSITPDKDGYESEYQQLISYKYENK